MNRGFGQFLVRIIVACFLALPFHSVGESQLEHNHKPIFHIEVVTTSLKNKAWTIDLSVFRHPFQNNQVIPTKNKT